MSDDLVGQLLHYAAEWDDYVFSDPMRAAAEEIKRLRATDAGVAAMVLHEEREQAAQLRVRLAAADKVVEAARKNRMNEEELDAALAAYDAAKETKR